MPSVDSSSGTGLNFRYAAHIGNLTVYLYRWNASIVIVMDGMVFGGSLQSWPETVTIFTDGACRGNPGPASVGIYVIDAKEKVVLEYGECIGTDTNNYAEYMAAIRAVEFAVTNKVKNLTLKSDSQLLIKQLIGEYKVKAANLIPLQKKCLSLARQIAKVEFVHVRREFNREADELANRALDSN